MPKTATKAAPETSLTQIEAIIEDNSIQKLAALAPMERTLRMATALDQLRSAIDPHIPAIMKLQGSRLGFLTDKQYQPQVVREVAVEAMLRGARMVMNEVNIIGGNLYLTQQYFRRALAEYPGLTELKLKPGVPQTKGEGAVVSFESSWVLNGKSDQLDLEIPVKVNRGMGVDAILGKADRKMRAAIFNQLTGSASDFMAPDGEVGEDVINVEAKDVTEEKSPEERILEQHESKLPLNELAALETTLGPDAALEAENRIYSHDTWNKVEKDDAWGRFLTKCQKTFKVDDLEDIASDKLDEFNALLDDVLIG